MNTYLTIMVTILVATQIIRITQNAINLHRQIDVIQKQIGWIKDTYPTDEDFKNQHECYRLLREWLEWKVEEFEREYTEQLDYDDDSEGGLIIED